MKRNVKKTLVSCLLALGIGAVCPLTSISAINASALTDDLQETVISADNYLDLTFEECEKIADSIDLSPNENGEVLVDLTDEELYAVITVSEYDKADIYTDIYDDFSSGADPDQAVSSYGYLYDQLNDKEKDLYNELIRVCQNFMDSKEDYSNDLLIAYYDTSINADRATAVFAAFYYENPQFYFLPARYLQKTDNIYNGQKSYVFGSDKSFLKRNDRSAANEQIKFVSDEWMSNINKLSATYEKEYYIASTLCDKITYDVNAPYNQTIYGSLIKNTCVCNGYAMAFTYLCRSAGIEAFGVPSPGHAWNMVKIENNWHCVDVTWMDGGNETNKMWYNRPHEAFVDNDDSTSHDIHGDYSRNFTLPVTVEAESNKLFLVSDGTTSQRVAERDIAAITNDPSKDYTVEFLGSGSYTFETDMSGIKAQTVTFTTNNNASFLTRKPLHINFHAVFKLNVYTGRAENSLYADELTVDGAYISVGNNAQFKSLTLLNNSTAYIYNSLVADELHLSDSYMNVIKSASISDLTLGGYSRLHLGGADTSSVSVDNILFDTSSQNSQIYFKTDSAIGNLSLMGDDSTIGVLGGCDVKITGDIKSSSAKINLAYMTSGMNRNGQMVIYNAAIPDGNVKMLTIEKNNIIASLFKCYVIT